MKKAKFLGWQLPANRSGGLFLQKMFEIVQGTITAVIGRAAGLRQSALSKLAS